MSIQPASGLDQYVIADSYTPATAGRDVVSGREPAPVADPEAEQGSAPAEEPPSASAARALPGVYARNARPVAIRMASPSISLLA